MKNPQATIPPDLALVGSFLFPENSANSQRVRTIASLLHTIGTKVKIGAANATPDLNPRLVSDEGIPVFHLSVFPDPKTPRLLKAVRYLFCGRPAAKWLASSCPPNAAVYMYGSFASYCWQLLNQLRRTRTPLIVDVVEWYQPSHVAGGFLGPFHLSNELAMRVLYPRARNIVAISRYLQNYFAAKGCHVLYIPAIMDVLAVSPNLEPSLDGLPLKLAYAGTPWKKDLLDPMIEAIFRLDPSGERIRFTLAGPSKEFLLNLPALRARGLTELPANLVALGYVTQEKVSETVREADFSVLLRHPNQRYAKAGFPTKVPESMAAGTPLIGNLTSDLGDFLRDGSNAIVCEQPTVEACLRALERGLSLTPDQRASMRRAAREQAEASFDFRQYVEPMRDFLSDLRIP